MNWCTRNMALRALFGAAALACVAVAARADTTADRIRAVEEGLSRPVVIRGRAIPRQNIRVRMRELHVNGVSIAVIHGYQIDWAKGYGLADVNTGRAVTPETLFQAGSISKPVAAVAAMKLVEDGKLSLDEDVNNKLRTWKVPGNDFTRNEKVTLRRLLSHTAGLTVHGFPGYEAGKPVPTVPQILDGEKPANTAAVRVDVVPGTIYRYSGGGYTIAQLLMTDVTGKNFADLLRDVVLSKIGMQDSSYQQPLPEKSRRIAASAYDRRGEPIAGKYHTYPEMAAAGLWTTASDLARFAIEIAKSREGRSNRVLRKETVQQMLIPVKDHYGLGFSLEGTERSPRFGHNGADEGFQAMMLATTSGDGLVVMANSDNGGQIAQEISYGVATAYGWPDYEPEQRTAITLPAGVLGAYAGTYQFPDERVRISASGDHIVVLHPRGEFEFYPESENTFFALLPGFPKLTFEKDKSGKVTHARFANEEGKRVE